MSERSGSYPDTAAETEAADMAAIAAGVPQALARDAERQAQSAAFIAEWGGEVNGGHSVVGTVPPVLGSE